MTGMPSTRTRRAQILSLIGAILMPLLVTSFFLWGTSSSQNRLHSSEAAIVNLDQGSTVNGQRVQLGQDYAVHLRNQDGPNFTWRYGITVDEAEQGLASGKYAAAVVIPEGFSRVLTGAAPKGQDTATLLLQRSPVTGVSDQLVLDSLSRAATSGLATGVAGRYLDNIFIASSQLGESLDTTAARAQELHRGMDQLSTQTKQTKKQTESLNRSATTAGTASQQLSNSAQQSKDDVAGQRSGATASGVVTSGVTTTSASQQKALDELEKATQGLATSATNAKNTSSRMQTSTSDAAAKAESSKTSALTMATAAARSKDAAGTYTGKVGDAATKQAEIQKALAGAQTEWTKHLADVQQVAAAVELARSRVSLVGTGASTTDAMTAAQIADQLTQVATSLRSAKVEETTVETVRAASTSASALSTSWSSLSAEITAMNTHDVVKGCKLDGNGSMVCYAYPKGSPVLLQEQDDHLILVECMGLATAGCEGERDSGIVGYLNGIQAASRALSSSGMASRITTLNTSLTTVSTSLSSQSTTVETTAANLERLAAAIRKLPATANVDSLNSASFLEAMKRLTAEDDATSKALRTLGTDLASQTTNLAQLVPGSDAARNLTNSATTLSGAAATQATTATALSQTLTTLNTQMTGMSTALETLQLDARTVSTNVTAASDGASLLVSQIGMLNKQLDELRRSTQQSATSTEATSTQAQALQGQISALQQAGTAVNTSVSSIDTSVSTQTERAGTVAAGVGKARSSVPSYDSAERQRLTDVIDAPVESAGAADSHNIGDVSMLLVVALWLGALAVVGFRPVVSEGAKTSAAPALRLVPRELAPSLAAVGAQSLLLAGLGQGMLHLGIGQLTSMTATLLLVGSAAVVINHSLRAFAGNVGVLVSVALVLLTAMGLVADTFPVGLDVMRRLSPSTPMLAALRNVMVGAPGLAGNLAQTAAWLAAGVLFSSLAILRRRSGSETHVPSITDAD